jgi:hypothetical protein
MPILPATQPREKRRTPVWMLILAVVGLPPVGLFAWSCYRVVGLELAGHGVGFGHTYEAPPGGKNWGTQRNNSWVAVKLPGGSRTGWYAAGWF